MAIESRGNNSYYYRSKRVGGRVVKEYVGRAVWSDIAYRMDRIDADRDRHDRLMFRWAIEKKQKPVDAFCRDALALSRLFLMAGGYHRHKRGEWRKQRMRKNTEIETAAKTTAAVPWYALPGATIPATEAERRSFVVKAIQGKDKPMIDFALKIVKKYPDEISLRYLNGIDCVIDGLAASESDLTKQVLYNEAEREKKSLYGGRDRATVPYAERLLIERVVACKFALSHAERQLHKDSMPLPKAEYFQRSIDRAHKRYLAAIETLARVQRLALPTINVAMPGSTQINVGEITKPQVYVEQVNATVTPAVRAD